MNKIKPSLDIIMDVLKETLLIYPTSKFVNSLHYQYQERGNLSRKQLEDLHKKAGNVPSISAGKLATLEAIILKKPIKYKSSVTAPKSFSSGDELFNKLLSEILIKYPLHKRVLFIKLKFDNKEAITVVEKNEIERFHKLLVK